MLTIRQHLQTFPEPYRSQAIENTEVSLIDEKSASASDAIAEAFVWDWSPEGDDYWRSFAETLPS